MEATKAVNGSDQQVTRHIVNGKLIRSLARDAGYKRDYMAAKAFDIERSKYSKILSGHRTPSADDMLTIAKKLGVSVENLYHELVIPGVG